MEEVKSKEDYQVFHDWEKTRLTLLLSLS